MENVRKRVSVDVHSYWEGRYGAARKIASPNFKKLTIFNENAVAIEMHPKSIKLDKPIIIGMAVLDISKIIMFDFHYNFMKEKYGERCLLAYTDTDSFVYELSGINFYNEMKLHPEKFDTSEFSENNPYGIIRQNMKVAGIMKDELNGSIMIEFIGLRAKMYSIISQSNVNIKKAKGVKTNVLKNDITHDDYLSCIQDNSFVLHKYQNSIRSKLHQVFTIRQRKVALSGADDKRCILLDNITTLPWGYKQHQS